MTAHAGGRRSLLTPETEQKFLTDIRIGMTITDAAAGIGIARRTFYNWQERGQAALDAVFEQLGEDVTPEETQWESIAELVPESEIPYARFVFQIPEAEMDGKRLAVASLRKAFADDWRAAAWYLERKHPDEYSRNATATVSISGRVQHVALDPADVDTIAGIVAAAEELKLGVSDEDDEQ